MMVVGGSARRAFSHTSKVGGRQRRKSRTVGNGPLTEYKGRTGRGRAFRDFDKG